MMLTNAKEYLQAISHKNYKVGDTVSDYLFILFLV